MQSAGEGKNDRHWWRVLPRAFAPFASTTDDFGRPEQQWMVNFHAI
jgi:hypothetical protein